MEHLRTALPPPNSLVYFEAAGRLRSFTAAAEELGVSQAAVSRQVRILEEYLNLSLFQRRHRAVALTPDGARFFESVTLGLRYIASSAAEVRKAKLGADLTVASGFAVMALWLRPRVTEYLSTRPGLDIHLVASDQDIDYSAESIDIGIRYGDGRWSDVQSQYLFEEEIFPVCSAAYLKEHRQIKTPKDLVGERLLHLDRQYPNWINWPIWLREQGVDSGAGEKGPKFNNYPILIQAAIDGQGVALGWSRLVSELLDKKILVKPIPAKLKSARAYYLASPVNKRLSSEAEALWKWLAARASAK